MLYDFIEFFYHYCLIYDDINHNNFKVNQIAQNFKYEMNQSLSAGRSGFRIVGKVIAPITDEKEIREVEIAQNGPGRFTVAQEHIRQAVSLYAKRPNPDFRNAMKEAISAVEGVIFEITGKSKFSEAIKQIKEEYRLHPAQADGLGKIYAYTSDADGIRHSLKDKTDVTEADARFLIVICSAFTNYLISLAES